MNVAESACGIHRSRDPRRASERQRMIVLAIRVKAHWTKGQGAHSCCAVPQAPPLPACGERSDSERSEAERWNPGEGASPRVRGFKLCRSPTDWTGRMLDRSRCI